MANWRIVKQGDTGQDVRVVQFLLRAHGSAIAADGDFAPQTVAAVKAFQNQKGLPADGEVGPMTWPKLVVQVGPGSTGEAVKAVQTQGLTIIPESPPLVVDGDFGPETQSRVMMHQEGWGLTPVDADVDVETWFYLLAKGPDLWPLVKPGASSETNFRVRAVQHLLRASGSGITADGQYGPQTTTAVTQFQSSHGVPADGIVGSQTWPKLITQVGPGDTGEAVKAVQSLFHDLTVDGDFGPQTEKRVRDLQDVFIPPADGIVGPKTWHLIVVPKSE